MIWHEETSLVIAPRTYSPEILVCHLVRSLEPHRANGQLAQPPAKANIPFPSLAWTKAVASVNTVYPETTLLLPEGQKIHLHLRYFSCLLSDENWKHFANNFYVSFANGLADR